MCLYSPNNTIKNGTCVPFGVNTRKITCCPGFAFLDNFTETERIIVGLVDEIPECGDPHHGYFSGFSKKPRFSKPVGHCEKPENLKSENLLDLAKF